MSNDRNCVRLGSWVITTVLLLFTGCIANIKTTSLDTDNSSPIPRAYEGLPIRGINIGNALDAPKPGQWGVEIRPDYFRVIQQAGFNTVRLPVRFSAHAGNEPPYAIDTDFSAMVMDLVNHGLDNGLIVILDMHHFDEIMVDPERYEEKLLSLWDQISRMFSTYPDSLYYEILNEPSGRLTRERWNNLSARVISVIRKNDEQRKIIVDTVDFSSINTIKDLSLPDDDNLIVTFHFYDPFEFTHQGAEWVNGSNRWLGNKWTGSIKEKEHIEEKLDQAANWSIRNKAPVIMGEFGTFEQADRASRILWTEFLARETEKRQMGWVYWQLCSNFALFSCEKGEWDEALLGALIPIITSK